VAKRKVKKESSLTRKQISRREKERRQRLILIAIAAVVGSLIIGILAYGVYQEAIAKPSAPIARVNGVPISTEIYQKRILFDRMQIDASIDDLSTQRSLYDPEADAFVISIIDQRISQLSLRRDLLNDESYIDRLADEELIRQAAAEQGISVTPEEIDRRIEQLFGYNLEQPTPVASPSTDTITSTAEITPTATPTPMTRARFEELYGNYLNTLKEGAGMSEAEYKQLMEVQLLAEKMQEFVGNQVPTTETQIFARHILLDTEDEARAVLERLQQGEDFATVATEVSTDTLTADIGGGLGWLPRGKMDEAFDDVAFNLPVGEISDVVETSRGFDIILVEERDENRELDADTLTQRKNDAFDVWLSDLRASASIEKYWSQDKVPPE
jgi:parvulin-like peptidyl-prolyl isomerase